MKKFFLLSVISLLLLASAAFAQKAQRIIFKRGAKQAVVSGTLYSYKGQRVYVIRVRAGQILKTEQVGGEKGGAITIAVLDPHGEIAADSDASCNNRKQTEETVAGDYKIIVSECSKVDPWRGTFRFKVRVQ